MKNKQGSGHTEMENSLIPHFLHAMQMCPDLCARHSAIKFPLRTESLGQDGIYPGGVQTLPGSLGQLICTALHFLLQINKQHIHFFSTN